MSYDIVPIELSLRTSTEMSLWHGHVAVPGRWSMPEILALVSRTYNVSEVALKGNFRFRSIAWPRQHAMWLMAQQPHLSLTMIGRFLGGRDHTTILHGRDAFAKRWAEQFQQAEAA